MASPVSGNTTAEERRAKELALLRASVARLRAGVMAMVFGLTGGLGLFLATVWLLVRGGPSVGKHLNLLGHYFPGYSVTWAGSLLGLVYGAMAGAVVGGGVAWIYNRVASRRDRF